MPDLGMIEEDTGGGAVWFILFLAESVKILAQIIVSEVYRSPETHSHC